MIYYRSYVKGAKTIAPGEARTHGLQIMRLTRCPLRYRGLDISYFVVAFQETQHAISLIELEGSRSARWYLILICLTYCM